MKFIRKHGILLVGAALTILALIVCDRLFVWADVPLNAVPRMEPSSIMK
ncbi:MAG: hypothetical protein RL292_342 [Candidatus Parcubacteria bacterium]|jgi:hypothetical protein